MDAEPPEPPHPIARSGKSTLGRMPLENLLLSPASLRALQQAGIRSLGQIECCSRSQLYALPGLGRKDKQELEAIVDSSS
jgi:hypothetical protein